MDFPSDAKYTKTHEWVKKDGDTYVTGITEYAQKELSDVVYVEMPEVGKQVEAGTVMCVVESVKAAFDIFAPMSGTVSEVNADLEGDPGLVNTDSYGTGWLIKINATDVSQYERLMDTEAYTAHVAGNGQ